MPSKAYTKQYISSLYRKMHTSRVNSTSMIIVLICLTYGSGSDSHAASLDVNEVILSAGSSINSFALSVDGTSVGSNFFNTGLVTDPNPTQSRVDFESGFTSDDPFFRQDSEHTLRFIGENPSTFVLDETSLFRLTIRERVFLGSTGADINVRLDGSVFADLLIPDLGESFVTGRFDIFNSLGPLTQTGEGVIEEIDISFSIHNLTTSEVILNEALTETVQRHELEFGSYVGDTLRFSLGGIHDFTFFDINTDTPQPLSQMEGKLWVTPANPDTNLVPFPPAAGIGLVGFGLLGMMRRWKTRVG